MEIRQLIVIAVARRLRCGGDDVLRTAATRRDPITREPRRPLAIS